jgi:coproporphyrinogen III oxidase-like Fe-S oxidoreductase
MSYITACAQAQKIGQETDGILKHVQRLGALLGNMVTNRTEAFFKKLIGSDVDQSKYTKIIRSTEQGVYALYIHIPFCHTPLCRFCCFVKYPYEPNRYTMYMSALKKEIAWLASSAEAAKIRVVYIGGGTPSINVYELAEVVDLLRSYFGRGLDVSTEASPIDIDDEAVSILRSAKVSRLSIGVQALDDKRLIELGRLHHKVEHSLKAVEAARGKFDTLNIDMIWGGRNDTVGRIREEADKALSLGADQVTFYPLMPAPGLRKLMRLRSEGPWHPLDTELYETIVQESIRHGYAPSTAWCMNRGARLIDEYIVDYDKFFALGVSGIGRLGNYAYANTFSIEKYVKLVEERGFSAAKALYVSPLEDMLYYASTQVFGLRFCPSALLERYGELGARFARLLVTVLRALGEHSDKEGCYNIRRLHTLYLVHVMQRGIYMGVNMFREWGLRTQA